MKVKDFLKQVEIKNKKIIISDFLFNCRERSITFNGSIDYNATNKIQKINNEKEIFLINYYKKRVMINTIICEHCDNEKGSKLILKNFLEILENNINVKILNNENNVIKKLIIDERNELKISKKISNKPVKKIFFEKNKITVWIEKEGKL